MKEVPTVLCICICCSVLIFGLLTASVHGYLSVIICCEVDLEKDPLDKKHFHHVTYSLLPVAKSCYCGVGATEMTLLSNKGS